MQTGGPGEGLGRPGPCGARSGFVVEYSLEVTPTVDRDVDPTSGRWRTIEHTADLAIEIEAPSLEALFVMAGHGEAGVLCGQEAGPSDDSAGTNVVWRELTLKAPDRESLLVEWLRELLHVQSSEERLFVDAEISDLTDTALLARAGFSDATQARSVERELKGVTYHALKVEERGGEWYARVVFDV